MSHRKTYTMMCAHRKCKLEVTTITHMTTPALPIEFKYCLLASNYEWHSIAGISILTYYAAYSEAVGSILIKSRKGLHIIKIRVIGMKASKATMRPLFRIFPHSLMLPVPYV